MLTKSESVFVEYCANRKFAARRIVPIPNGGRFPDFELTTLAGVVVVEIKELTPSQDDRRFFARMVDGVAETRKITPGARVRQALKEAARQLGRYKNSSTPEMVVLYDNLQIDGQWFNTPGTHLGPTDISVGMFGEAFWSLSLRKVDGAISSKKEMHGGKRQLTETTGRHISAIGVLHDGMQSKQPWLTIYHNPLTTKALSRQWFPDPKDQHFVKPNGAQDSGWRWTELADDLTGSN